MNDSAAGVHTIGHREFIGGTGPFWESISKLQFEFLVSRGLKKTDHLFDIGCGSLRGGVRLIDYLDPDRYVGIDKHIELIIYGAAEELGIARYKAKRPRFLISDRFDFRGAGHPVMAIAQSLFTHLEQADIATCLTNLRSVAAPGCRFFATFFEANTETPSDERSHSHRIFWYTRAQMEAFGAEAGWHPKYIGPWHHPRDQHMMEFVYTASSIDSRAS